MQTREDAFAIVDMAQELALAVDDPKPSTTAEALLQDGFGPARWFDCWLAENELEPIGYALACRGFEAHTGKRRLWLGDLYVRPTARHGGAGRALVAAVAWHALALGCDAMYWEFWRQNVGGRAFYRQLEGKGADRSGDHAARSAAACGDCRPNHDLTWRNGWVARV